MITDKDNEINSSKTKSKLNECSILRLVPASERKNHSSTRVPQAISNQNIGNKDVASRNKIDKRSNQLFRIKEVEENDIIFVRGRGFHMHSGNRRMLTIVQQYKTKYRTARRREKRILVEQVYQRIVQNGARFLIRVSEESNNQENTASSYEEADLSVAMAKVSNALRCTKVLKGTRNNGDEADCIGRGTALKTRVAKRQNPTPLEVQGSSTAVSQPLLQTSSAILLPQHLACMPPIMVPNDLIANHLAVSYQFGQLADSLVRETVPSTARQLALHNTSTSNMVEANPLRYHIFSRSISPMAHGHLYSRNVYPDIPNQNEHELLAVRKRIMMELLTRSARSI